MTIAGFEAELTEEFFRAVAANAKLTVHLATRYGSNTHHLIEACFKAFARALREAIAVDPDAGRRAEHEGDAELTRIAVLDYGMGNLRSVEKALERVGAEAVVTHDPETVRGADGLILPGVGAFAKAMERIDELGLAALIDERLEAGDAGARDLSRLPAAVRVVDGARRRRAAWG